MQIENVLFLLIAAHFLCDFPLQGDYLSKLKNRYTPEGEDLFLIGLTAHSMIHAGAVLLVTNNIYLALFQFITHFAIDAIKCEKKITYVQDQVLHIFVMICIWIIFCIVK